MCDCGGSHETIVRIICRTCRVQYDYHAEQVSVVCCWSHGYYSYVYLCPGCGNKHESPTTAYAAERMIDAGSPTITRHVAQEFMTPGVRHDHRVPPILESEINRFMQEINNSTLLEIEMVGLSVDVGDTPDDNDRSQQ
jgi:hypothetical protein